MDFQDWDIWHTYSSFLESEELDLKTLGVELVRNGIGVCAMHSDGDTWWLGANQVENTKTEFSEAIRYGNSSFRFEAEESLLSQLEDYTRESWYQSAYFRYCEYSIFPDILDSIEYIRIYVGEFHTTSSSENFGAILYPVLKIYKSGVVLVQYRTIAPDRDIELEGFISRHVNFGMHSLDKIEVPPMIAHYAAISYHHSVKQWRFLERWKLYKAEAVSMRTAEAETDEIQSGEFLARLIQLPSTKDRPETLASLSLALLSIIGFFANKPRLRISYLLFGQKPIEKIGNYWHGRPHIHILKFKEQKKSSFKILRKYSHELALIHARTNKISRKQSIAYLPENLRKSDDYIAQVSEAVSLWVWSKNGTELRSEQADLNRGHLIYEHQAIMEFMEYRYMLQRALLSKVESADDMGELVKLKKLIIESKALALHSSKYGELKELFDKGWQAQKLDELQALTNEQLSIRTQESEYREAKSNIWKDRALTILFGILAIPTLSEKLLVPIWSLFVFWRPANELVSELFFLALSTAIVLLTILRLLQTNR